MNRRRGPHEATGGSSCAPRRGAAPRDARSADRGRKDITVQILKDIRAELKDLRTDVKSKNDRLTSFQSDVNDRFGALENRVESVESRLVASEIRLATELVAVAAAVREVRDVLLEDRALRAQVNEHETRIRNLEHRAG